MILCLLFLLVVFAAFFRVIAAALFGVKPDSLAKGEANWLTLAPGVALIALILILGLYLPPQLMSLLNGASSLVLSAAPAPQIAVVSVEDFLLPLAHLLP
jgi:formate hydrogenlyase subunit 3/multisubunit Na+/H+ antiporter MnhD subunit